MTDDVRTALLELAERGTPAGGHVVVSRAEALVSRRHRRFGRAFALSVAATVVVVGVAVGGSWFYAQSKLGQIERLDLAGVLAGSASPAEPMTVLVAGSDSRAGLDGADSERFGSAGEVGGARADTVLVLRVEPGRGVRALSLPRDLWVPIDGAAPNRLNAALGEGPDALVRTVQSVLGLRLDHYVQVDFDAFRRLVDAVGGVTMRFDAPARDRVTGLRVGAGCVRLDGDQALALVRSRHLQELVAGRWRTDPTGDLGRIGRQQRFLLDLLADVASSRDPLTLTRLLDVAADEVAVDDGFGNAELLDLGRRLGAVDAGQVTFVSVPVTPGRTAAGAAVLLASPGALVAAGESLLTPPAAATPPTGPGTSTTATPPC
jgi:LCP family protein required for cell wall assembly